MEVGIDIEDINRFKKYTLEKDLDFLNTIFSTNELKYCFSQSFPARHLAGRFCAKEAFYKATSEIYSEHKFSDIEIITNKNGKPYIKLPTSMKIDTSVSISHDKTKAIAVVVVNDSKNNNF